MRFKKKYLYKYWYQDSAKEQLNDDECFINILSQVGLLAYSVPLLSWQHYLSSSTQLILQAMEVTSNTQCSALQIV